METELFISVNDDPEYWGRETAGFDSVAESDRIERAAIAAGISVDRNGANAPHDSRDMEVDWWTTWCREGHAWTCQQWTEWFEQVVNPRQEAQSSKSTPEMA